MLRRIVGILVLVAVCSVAVAAQSHRLRSTWKAPGIEPLNFGGQKVAAVVISSDDSLRISAEEALTREITARGPEGIAAYRVIPRELIEDATKTQAWFEQAGVSGVVTMRVVSVEKETKYSSVAWTSSYYRSFSDYYMTSWQTVTPISRREDTIVAVETLLYDVAEGKLLWASVSESTNPKQVGTFIEGLVNAVVEELQNQGLVRRTR